MQLTILMPCLNEAETLGRCITKARQWIAGSGIKAEILIADNGSSDGSQEIAAALGARVVEVAQRGYGAALYHGSMAAQGEWIIMGDADDSYDFSQLDAFCRELAANCDLVVGNRFQGGIAPGAMPWKNRYLGNPLLSWLGRLLFRSPVRDFHCGLRGYRKSAFLKMDLRTSGMEFASEMVIKATMLGLRIAEVPTTLDMDGRSRPPHLRPWRDGWRHLRFMLLFSPRWLFIIPGALLGSICLFLFLLLLSGPARFGTVVLDMNTLLFAEAGLVLASLAIATGVAIRLFGIREGLLPPTPLVRLLHTTPILEIGGLAGIAMILAGLAVGANALTEWAAIGFGPLTAANPLRQVSLSTLLTSLGGIVLTSSLLIGFLTLPMRGRD